ncbi:MAG: hypothetical protein DRH15_09750 [Deltaproteobacteria bacterium]|nr:MAG: hypothetical protein DRH15_09750 [Deltaproteobacteria bacterium]
MKLSVKSIIAVFLCLICSLAANFCVAQEIAIGVLLPLNGKMSIIGDVEKKAIEMAVQELKASSPEQQTTFALHFGDTMGDPGAARQAAMNLIDEHRVSILIGGCSSSASLAIAQLAEEHSVPFLITTASADKLTEMDLRFTFRLCLPVSEQSKPMFNLLSKVRGSKKVCILREDSRYGRYETRSIVRICRKTRALISDIVTYPVQDTLNEAPYFPRLQKISPDILLVISQDSESVRVLALAQVLDKPPRLIFCKGAPFLMVDTYLDAQSTLNTVYTSSPWHQNAPYPGAQGFAQRFYEMYGIVADYHAAQAYAAIQVIVDAISRALSPDSESIREALEQTDVMSIYGQVHFQSYGDKERQSRPPMVLLRWSGEDLQPVPY